MHLCPRRALQAPMQGSCGGQRRPLEASFSHRLSPLAAAFGPNWSNGVSGAAVLVCATRMALCGRVVEVTDFPICDIIWELDAGFDASYAGTLAVHIYQRKQDTERKVLYPRIGSRAGVGHRSSAEAARGPVRAAGGRAVHQEAASRCKVAALLSFFLHPGSRKSG